MATYTETPKGKSGAEAESQDVDTRKATEVRIKLNPDGDGWHVIEHFEQHKPETTEFSRDERTELLEYVESCLGLDEEGK